MPLCLHSLLAIILFMTVVYGCAKHEEARPRRSERPLGEAVFAERCRDCHKINKKGGDVGPDLTGIGKKHRLRFIEQVIRDPSTMFPGTVMPPYHTLPVRQVKALVHYVGTSQAPEPPPPKNAMMRMKRIWNERQE